jgi:predicted dehydrogenase
VRVLAQAHAFTPERIDPTSGAQRPVGTPDSVQAMTHLPNGARGVYQISGAVPVGGGVGVLLFGTKGALHYDFTSDRIFGTQGGPMAEIHVSSATGPSRGWRVEADFIQSIREGTPVRLTDFESGVAYMEFTEAVAGSALAGAPMALPLE